MPWKIHKQETVLAGKAPRLVMWDASVDLFLVTELNTGVVDIFIGADRPRFANIHVTIDSERTPVIQLEHAFKCNEQQCAIVSSVLATMGINDQQRHAILQKAKAIWHNEAPAFILSGSFPTRDERDREYEEARRRRPEPRRGTHV